MGIPREIARGSSEALDRLAETLHARARSICRFALANATHSTLQERRGEDEAHRGEVDEANEDERAGEAHQATHAQATSNHEARERERERYEGFLNTNTGSVATSSF